MAQGTSYGDVEVKVMVKAVAGVEDQGGGPIWRAKDADNYYICRWNPLENNFRVYFVKDGRRKQLGTADVKTDANIWHEDVSQYNIIFYLYGSVKSLTSFRETATS